ncbi:uncharacterized protein LOC119590631 [Penaeus monodon]|uniref:uncharacterized protein LOC119590631 n=1 Tax=Penaeus monodon TaxID=6687 RepID=UPI0018A72FCC|nr:uncharacterized protein LOC119590631 [Penaeus monodon]
MYDYIDYKLLFFGEDVIHRILQIRNQALFVINGIKKVQEHDNLLFSKEKIYTVNNVMELASCTASDDDADADTNNPILMDIIGVLIYGILNEGWSESTMRCIENELVDKCLVHKYITEEEYRYCRKKYNNSDNDKSKNDNIPYIIDFLWNMCYFNKLYRDRYLNKNMTLRLIEKSTSSMSRNALIKHDLSFFHLPTAAGIAIYEYLTHRDTNLRLVKEAAKTLVAEEKYLRYSRNIRNTIEDDTTNKKKNIRLAYVNKRSKTSCALLLCKSASKINYSKKDTKSKLFNLQWLFNVTDIQNQKFKKCLGVIYDSIDVGDMLPNTSLSQKSKPLDWYYRFMNTGIVPFDQHNGCSEFRQYHREEGNEEKVRCCFGHSKLLEDAHPAK